MESDIKKIVIEYFRAWNNKDIEKLKKLFDKKIVLKDWEYNEIGIENVLNVNEKLFKNVPSIRVEIVDILEGNEKIMAQIKVYVSDDEVIDVVDLFIIKNELITNIQAYKC